MDEAVVLLSDGKQDILCSKIAYLTLSRVHTWNLTFEVACVLVESSWCVISLPTSSLLYFFFFGILFLKKIEVLGLGSADG